MNITLEKVYERDIDFLVMRHFTNYPEFRNLFFDKIGLKAATLVSIQHSLSDENGESDITIILKNEDKTIGLLVENKINAIAMKNQYERYVIRGEKGIANNDYEKYYIFMIAPKHYLENNSEAVKYNYSLSYEEIYNYLKFKDTFDVEVMLMLYIAKIEDIMLLKIKLLLIFGLIIMN